MSTPGILIFCERSGAWAADLRREPGIRTLSQRETRSLAECREALVAFPASLLVLEITSTNLEQALEWLSCLPRDFPQTQAVVVAQRGLEPYEWAAREFGALAFTASPRELAPVARLIVRYFESLPKPEMPLEEQIWSQLPWASSATGESR